VPEIRIGSIRFVGQEALRSQRWAITALLLAKALFWLSLTVLLCAGALKAEPLHIVYRPNNGSNFANCTTGSAGRRPTDSRNIERSSAPRSTRISSMACAPRPMTAGHSATRGSSSRSPRLPVAASPPAQGAAQEGEGRATPIKSAVTRFALLFRRTSGSYPPVLCAGELDRSSAMKLIRFGQSYLARESDSALLIEDSDPQRWKMRRDFRAFGHGEERTSDFAVLLTWSDIHDAIIHFALDGHPEAMKLCRARDLAEAAETAGWQPKPPSQSE
jgi:hypothetical protein